ncbi:MAG: hypothetical protein K9K64_08575 [Desulfohalobiaceae bacterium]|nr:hypothetical protein [Desulfohalobiaceae bacterium]
MRARAAGVMQVRDGRTTGLGQMFMGLDEDGESQGCLPLDVAIFPRAVSLYAQG